MTQDEVTQLFHQAGEAAGWKPGVENALVINTENTDIDGYKPDDFDIVDYKHQPHIKLPIAV